MVEDIAYRSANECAEIEEFAIYTMECSLEEIALPWVLGVKELKKVEDEWVIDVPFCEIRVEVRAFNKSKEKLVDNLKMRPGELEDRLVLLWIECVPGGVDGRGYRAKEVDSKLGQLSYGALTSGQETCHVYNLGVYILGDHPSLSGDVLEHFMQSLRFNLFTFELGAGIVEVE